MDSAPAEASFVRVKGASDPITSRSGAGVNSDVNCESYVHNGQEKVECFLVI